MGSCCHWRRFPMMITRRWPVRTKLLRSRGGWTPLAQMLLVFVIKLFFLYFVAMSNLFFGGLCIRPNNILYMSSCNWSVLNSLDTINFFPLHFNSSLLCCYYGSLVDVQYWFYGWRSSCWINSLHLIECAIQNKSMFNNRLIRGRLSEYPTLTDYILYDLLYECAYYYAISSINTRSVLQIRLS